MFCIITSFLASCSNTRQECGLHGYIIDEGQMTLGGDTFSIRYHISDKLLIVQKGMDIEFDSCYLLKTEGDGLYRIQAKDVRINPIDSTERFVIFDNGEVFDTENEKVLFRTARGLNDHLKYLCYCDNKLLFGSRDALCFSDGKYAELQPNALYQLKDDNDMIHFTIGAQSMDISPKELHQRISKPIEADPTIKHIKKGYFVRPRTSVCEGIGNGIGFDVDMDVPTGSSTADIAIRQWMATQIRNNVFDLLEYNPEKIKISKCGSVKDMLRCLDLLGNTWKEKLRNEYIDTLYDKRDSRIAIKRIVDCKDYATYFFSCVTYNGGVHAAPWSYYATYDKRRNVFLTKNNTIKESARSTVVTVALRDKKKQHHEQNGQECEWKDYIKMLYSVWGVLYCCDKKEEWQNKSTSYNISDFPLPHLAIIPEGLVVTYHPYQIDCFADGEYHAVMPLKDIAECLKYEYGQVASPKRLDWFVKMGVE